MLYLGFLVSKTLTSQQVGTSQKLNGKQYSSMSKEKSENTAIKRCELK